MNTETNKRIANDLQLKFWRAEDRMRAAMVPAADRDGAPREPVTVGGYYHVPTKSGRAAWARFEWRDGAAKETHCTYDPATVKTADDLVIAGADPLWIDE